MGQINTEILRDILSKKYSNADNLSAILNKEGFSESMITNRPNEDFLLHNYLLGNKEVNKQKRLDPSLNIIDADDIDWTGYEITFYGKTFKISSTFDLLELIFRLINDLYAKHGSNEIAWNDKGENRSFENVLNWGNGKLIDPTTQTNYDDNSSTILWEEKTK